MTDPAAPTDEDTPSVSRRTVIISVIVAAVLGSVLMIGILRMTDEPKFARVSLDGTKPAPEVTGKDLMTDEPLALSDFRGKPVVINVWAEWCLPCRQEAPALQEFAERNPDVAMLGIGSETERPIARKFNEQMGWTYPSIYDSGNRIVWDVLRIGSFPATYYVDADGIMRGKSPGIVTLEELEDAAERLREPVATTP